MKSSRLIALTVLTMIAFAGNSLLCRLALKHTRIDAASFTAIRLLSGALTLYCILRLARPRLASKGDWLSASALFVYAAGFSFAYISLPAATGALLLFGAVQATMLSRGLWLGERLGSTQIVGLLLAFGGLIVLFLPGLSAPPAGGAVLMLVAGIAWGIYSLRGRGVAHPLAATAGNFMRSIAFAALLILLMSDRLALDRTGVGYAIVSGALASGIGYAIWYSVLPALRATHASTVQLSVPLIAALGGVVLLDEPVNLRLALASAMTLGGIALVIMTKAGAPDVARQHIPGSSDQR